MTLLQRRATPKKAITQFRPQIRSQHPSHDILRGTLDRVNKRVVIRLGSTTTLQAIYGERLTPTQLGNVIEINKVEAVKNSANKLLMKQKFTEAGVETAIWYQNIDGKFIINNNVNEIITIDNLPYPIISKSLHGSRGNGNIKHDTQAQLEAWMRGKDLSNYIFEKFYTYSKEYRIHVTNDGCFYTCRKLLKNTAPEGTWQRHDDGNVTWIVEENPKFMKPANWNAIVADCIKAKNALGLDICSFDVMTQASSKENPKWIIVESQSAPSFGEITAIKYKEELNKLIKTRL
jgi:glutathione synthase/RimK-type ligase-like ATP-grasp enzyme